MNRQADPDRPRLPLLTEKFVWHDDCRYFQGGLPCSYWRPCPGCENYDPVRYRVLIVMLSRHGDMLIASPLPARIKYEHPDAHITWLVDDGYAPIVSMNPHVDRVLCLDWKVAAYLPSESFDAVYGFEREPHAAALVDRIGAPAKAGLAYGGPQNSLYAIGEPAEDFFLMNTWNDYRTRANTRTWTELYFEVAGFQYEGEPYVLTVPNDARQSVARFLGDTDDRHAPRICLNVGGFVSTKRWPAQHWINLGHALLAQRYQLVITGGPTDDAVGQVLYAALADTATRDVVRYRQLSIEEFAAVPALCDAVVTGDSLGFHLALAHARPCVLMLGPSSGAEVLPKHVTNVITLRSNLPCSPCAHQVACGGAGGCMDAINPQDVVSAIASLGVRKT
jgi:heptosyltransferase-1